MRVARISLSSLLRTSSGAISRPRAGPPATHPGTHRWAKFPRLHVRAHSDATRKSTSSRRPTLSGSGFFRVAASRRTRLPWKPRPWLHRGKSPATQCPVSPAALQTRRSPGRRCPPCLSVPASCLSRRGRSPSRRARICGSRSATVAPVEEMLLHGFSAEHYFPVSHFTMISHTPCPQDKSETVNPKTCSPKEYLETFIFPVLLPGMASLLHQAKKEKCFEPTAANPTLSPADRRGSGPLHSILLESLFGKNHMQLWYLI
uniref:IQ motif containing K n=1 Tax=Piliocolobus tephrosceles TaxID=591936 RepID=A0A8C9GUS5_9PRIM